MKKNRILQLLLLILFLVPLGTFGQQQPNVVLILADDLDATVTPQFFPEVLPTLDSLMKYGIDFQNSFTPMSICCPSRAGLLSGKYGHETEVLRNGGEKGGWDDFQDDEPQALPAHLSKAGYRTAMFGKYMNGYETHKGKMPPLPYGWTDGAVFVDPLMGTYKGYDYDLMVWSKGTRVNDTTWHSENKKIETHGKLPEDYSTDVLAGKAAEYIKSSEQNDAQPFFLYLTPTPPHFPIPPAVRHEAKTLERWLHDNKAPERPNTYNDFGKLAGEKEKKKPLDKPSWLRETWKKRMRQRNRGDFHYGLMFEGKIPRELKSFSQSEWFYRMGSLYALNDLLDDVIATLKATGEWENTLLIVTSDNGFQFGNHALYHKGSPYEESIRVPLVITGGNALHLKNATKPEEWTINQDLMPTILDFAGVPVPGDLDGKSLRNLISQGNAPTSWRDHFIMQYLGPGMTTDFIARHPKLIFKIMPSFVLDHPSFKAIRMKTETGEVFKYIEWEKYHGHFKFRKKLETKDPKLMAKIEAGNKRTVKKQQKMEVVESELYNITDDPYEMDNLLYYKPDENKDIVRMLQMQLLKELTKDGSTESEKP